MGKNIILLSDGTGNSSGKVFKTNVWRIYQAVDLSGPDHSNPNKVEQIAYYDDGVGTSSFKPMAIIGGAFGWGLKRNVIHLYTFLCWNYKPGDQIYCFGFSRGAFTIRVLTGLISSQGLVQSDEKAELMRLATNAFRAYRAQRYKSVFRLERPARALGHALIRAKNRIMRVRSYKSPDENLRPPIKFLGLWDTVAAYGLPIDELTRAWNAFFPLSTPDREPSSQVQRACHALALDDERNTFHPVLWNEANLPQQNGAAKHIADERITQVWFTGMHSNVGGGYPDDALANVSLDWMMSEAEREKLVFKIGERDRVKAAADVCGKLYDSRHGLGGTYRYFPRKLSFLTHDADNKKNQVIIVRPKIHASVFERIKRSADGYAPFVLPPKYAVVTNDGDILDMPQDRGSADLLEDLDQATSRSNVQENVWNLVWWKRVVYFTAIILAGILVAFPLFRPATLTCEGPLCGLSGVVRAMGILLPSLANPWLKAYESHPGSFGLLVILLALFIYLGSQLQVAIFDRMRRIWRPILTNPESDHAILPLPCDLIFRLRSSWLYQRCWKITKRMILPFVAGTVAVLLILGGISQSLFAVISSTGLTCEPTPDHLLKAGVLDNGIFVANNVCSPTGVQLKKGKRYRLTLMLNDPKSWKDGDEINPGIGGFGVEKMTALMYAGLPFRRHVREPWFKPVARVGVVGSDEYPLNPVDLSIPGEGTEKLVAEITARRDGELFLFVNDAVLPVPAGWQIFYINNQGTATLTVHPATDGP
jgi:uncharacterized protein (DUF2235 family)